MKIKLKFKEELRSYLIIGIGLVIGSFAWTGFLIPAEIVGSGITGVGTIIYYTLGIKVGVSVFVINTFLLLIAIKILGASFGLKTIYAISILSFCLWFFQIIITEPLVSDRFMCAIIGGILAGAGAGVILSEGGSTGGTDIIAMMINKYKNYSPGKILLSIDLVIISSSYFVFHSIEQVVYGLVAMGVSAYCVDLVIQGNNQSVQILVFTKKHEILRKEIIEVHDQGLTILNAEGAYSHQNVKVLMMITRKKDSQCILKSIRQLDPDAFVSMGTVMGVYGLGFDNIK